MSLVFDYFGPSFFVANFLFLWSVRSFCAQLLANAQAAAAAENNKVKFSLSQIYLYLFSISDVS